MFSTPASLLERLRKPSETTAWGMFVELYSPLLFHWARRLVGQDADAADLVQDVFLLLYRKLPEFGYDSSRSFHAWLKTVFLNQHRARLRQRVPVPVANVGDDVPESSVDEFADPEYRQYLIHQAFKLIAQEFTPLHQAAFRQYVLEERPPEEVARALDVSIGTVYGIKSKVLSRLRQELRDLLD